MLTNQMHKLPTAIIPAWLAISLINEVFVHSHALTKVLLTDQSGFFATGVLLYELYRARSDLMTRVNLMFAASVAVTQGVLNSYLMAAEFKLLFDPYVVAAICIAIILLAFAASRAERMPLPAQVVLALGGLTYPLYLFHAEIGYVAFVRLGGRQDQVATGIRASSALDAHFQHEVFDDQALHDRHAVRRAHARSVGERNAILPVEDRHPGPGTCGDRRAGLQRRTHLDLPVIGIGDPELVHRARVPEVLGVHELHPHRERVGFGLCRRAGAEQRKEEELLVHARQSRIDASGAQ